MWHRQQLQLCYDLMQRKIIGTLHKREELFGGENALLKKKKTADRHHET